MAIPQWRNCGRPAATPLPCNGKESRLEQVMRIILIIFKRIVMRDLVNISARSDDLDNLLPTAASTQNKVIDSNTLFTRSNVVLIQHRGDCYMLRRTRNGKLILTK